MPFSPYRNLFVTGFTAVALWLASATMTSAQQPAELRIAAAADLQPVLPTLADQFEKQTHIKVVIAYGSSATLATQILNGGPFSLFLSADQSFPQEIIAAGLADSFKPILYARGTLVLWARNDSPLQPISIESLRNPALRTIAVANAEHAPYGRAAKAALENLGLMDTLKSRLVVAENIAQTAGYVDSGNAQIGLISLTSALTPRLSAEGHYTELPQNLYPPLLQAAVVLKQGSSVPQAHQFLDFLLSTPVRQQFAARGLKAP